MGAGQKLKEYIVDSQFYVSLMGTMLATFFMLEQHSFRYPTMFLIFITYFGGYLYTKYQETKGFKEILVICGIAGLICMYLIFKNHNIDRLYKWLFICVLGFLYNSSFLLKTIRKVPLLKIFYVGLVWALVNAWLSFHHFNWPIFTISILFIAALVLPFDIRDMDTDDLLTFPKLIGIQKTKILAYILLLLSAILGFIYLQLDFAIAFGSSVFVAMTFVYFTKKENRDSYFSFWVESCSGLPLIFWTLYHFIQK